MVLTALKNKSKHTVVLVLDHPAFANRASGWQRTTAEFASAQEDGSRVVSEVRRSYAGTLTLLPGETIPDLHPAVRNCSQVTNLRRTGVLQLIEEQDAKSGAKPSVEKV